MNFNRFAWELYIQSSRGEKAVRRFSELTSESVDGPRVMPYRLTDKNDNPFEFEQDVAEIVYNCIGDCETQEEVQQDFVRCIEEGIAFHLDNDNLHEDQGFLFGDREEHWYDFIGAISMGLHLAYTEFFLPYNFGAKFSQLDEIHSEFSIPLPPVPTKADKRGRGLYYLAINQAWQDFRCLHGMSPAEMCAFLYDYAPEFITPLNSSDLPSASKAWLVTSGKGDFQAMDAITPESVFHYAGNSAVRRGDILIMYLVSPRSRIESIWRACSDAFVDPFFHYHNEVWICAPIKTKPVTFEEMKQHPLLSEKGAIKANFQGPSSKAGFSVEEYEAILEIMANKGQDLSVMPRIPSWSFLPSFELLNERDVEINLIEPFLRRLGYMESDWVRQMPVKMGRGERNYPDYAICAKATRGEECAKMVVESKFQLSAQRDFIESFYQTKSYALRLQCKTMVMAAREGVWVFPRDDGGFSAKNFIFKTWGELENPDAFHQVLCLIGRDLIVGKERG